MTFAQIPWKPGVYKDDSALAAGGHFTNADNMRFVRVGENILPQIRGGYEKFSTTSLTGYGRGIFTWTDSSRNPYVQVGTEYRLYTGDLNGTMIDSTPVLTYGTLTNPFATSAASTTILVTHTSHGLSTGQLVRWPYLSVSINNATITNSTRYPVTVLDVNTYTFAADTPATLNGAATTGLNDYQYGLAPGMTDGIYGAGYGTGAYGSGNYAGSNTVTVYPRTWSFADWGNNSVSNPRGGPIFEWAPNTAETELVANAYCTGTTGWTFGTNWTATGNYIFASITSAALAQNISPPVAAWCNLHIAVSVVSGTFSVTINSSGIASISSSGNYNYQFYSNAGGTQALQLTGAAFKGKLRQVNITALTTGQQITSAPNPCTCIMSTAERALVACGINDSNGNFAPMKVAWTDRGLNQVWTAATTNLAGANTLSNGSRIVTCKRGLGENLIWTDKALYAMRANPDPNVVYDFFEIGQNCGCIGANAAVVVNGIAFWITPAGAVKVYNGGPPTDLNCTVRQDFFNNIAWVQQDKIHAHVIGGFTEVEWSYPDLRDGIEVSRYIKYNWDCDVWDNGTTTRTCWQDAGIYQFPISMKTDGNLYYEEKGQTANGALMTASLTGSSVQGDGGSKWIRCDGIRPDVGSMQGGYALSITGKWRDIRGKYSRTWGPYNVNANTGKTALRFAAQEMIPTWSFSGAPLSWRMGKDQYDLTETNNR